MPFVDRNETGTLVDGNGGCVVDLPVGGVVDGVPHAGGRFSNNVRTVVSVDRSHRYSGGCVGSIDRCAGTMCRWGRLAFNLDSSALEETAKDLVGPAGGWKTILLVLVVVVGAPLVEELVHRGLLQRSASARFGSLGGCLLVDFFGLIHSSGGVAGLAVAGLVFGIMLLRTAGSASIITHASFNATGIFALLLFN